MAIAIVNTKGGVGKTTTAVHLAALFSRCGATLLIDGDPQASAASWAAWRREAGYEPSPVTTSLLSKAVYQEGKELARGFEYTLVDAGGKDSSALRGALLLARLAIVPIGASSLDTAALTDLLEIVEMARDYNPELSVRVLMNRLDPRIKEVGELSDYLEQKELAVLNSRIGERVAYRRAVSKGAIVDEVRRDESAIQEMNALFEEIRHAG